MEEDHGRGQDPHRVEALEKKKNSSGSPFIDWLSADYENTALYPRRRNS
jgi:hypothetical protein